ncbi:hypothetical protein N8I77_012344 [Diaporthe amygdali]|uniref:Uncharacterized protein n=1 Tax=Phomopsis amygdali TaxID=1214568 RepID=A0AAD9S3C7_PHOAM|nr:hypothetical protein N8I77_012344 [Diaporthe amygdali]
MVPGYVGWQAIHSAHPPNGNEPREEEFHQIIGYRYSQSRLDRNAIAMAKFPTTFQRKLVVEVTLAWPPATGGSGAGVHRVKLPYQTEPAPVQTFNNGGGSSGGSGRR